MISKKLALTNDQASPLFRIMWVYDETDLQRRRFENNISAFHIGNGYVLSVAHNLRTESQLVKSVSEEIYQNEFFYYLNDDEKKLFNKYYSFDRATNKRYLEPVAQPDIQTIINNTRKINFDTRWSTLAERGLCKPHLIVQFKNDRFYNDEVLTHQFNAATYFPEPALNRNTFLLEVKLVDAFYSEDIALYKIVNTSQEIVDRLSFIEVDCSVLNDDQHNFYCLQSSPNSVLGRLLNKAQIEGFVDHHGIFGDHFGGNYIFEGLRYLIKGYFRFGSSGSPYIFFDEESGKFKVNAIQSEACPIQLSINNNKEGNFQYINALASPLNIVKDRLEKYLHT